MPFNKNKAKGELITAQDNKIAEIEAQILATTSQYQSLLAELQEQLDRAKLIKDGINKA